MTEIRAIIKNLDDAGRKAIELGAKDEGEYAFIDVIFVPKKNEFNLDDVFLRLRVYSKNNWNTKPFIVVRKKDRKLVLKEEFETEEEALKYISNNLGEEFERGFQYSREGWQYDLNGYKIYIEDIEKIGPSMEIEGSDEGEVRNLLVKIGIEKIMEHGIPETIKINL